VVGVAARRNARGRIHDDVVGDRAGQGAAEYPVSDRELGHAVTGARELLAQRPPAAALRKWMDLFGDWIATKNGMLDTLLAMIKSGEITHAQTRTGLLTAITEILDAGRAAGDLRADITAEDIAASLLGIFTVAQPPQHKDRARRLLNILMDGLRPPG
jgi:hypothetical protein